MSGVKVEWMGDKIKGLVRQGATRGLLAGAEVVKAAAVAQTPVESGDLKKSATADVDSGTLISAVAFSDTRRIKVIKQHEDLSYRHPNGGNAKFLENAAKEAGNSAYQKLAASLRQVLT